MSDLLAHEHGPRTAGQTYSRTAEAIALDALIGRLPDDDTKARFYAAHEGILAKGRASVASYRRAQQSH